ncbi:MAG: transposase [Patescibacteria group bacterium]
MSAKRPSLANGEIYHIVTRAIEGLKLFRDEKDYFRMISDLFAFNNVHPISSTHRWQINKSPSRTFLANMEGRKLLVEILAFCLMPNHVHLLVRQLQDGGISKFMRKIGAGYSAYYNQRYKRMGHVFQGRYRLVHIENDKQLYTIFVYIHTNPVAIIFSNWKEGGIQDAKKAIDFVKNYKWSSYPDYLESKNFPSLTNREFLTETMGGINGCRESVNSWLEFKKELADFEKVVIE